MRLKTAPSYDIDFYGDEFIRDPYPHYERMRTLGPVIWLPQHNNFALTRHAEVRDALRNHEVFVSGKGVAGDKFGCDFLQGNTVASDEPRHAELRRAMAPPLLPGALKHIERSVKETADTLIDDLVSRKRFDAVADLARHLPLTIVRDMVGLPEFGQENMLEWAAAAFDVLGMQNQRGQDALEVIAEMRDFIRRDATRDKLKPGSWTHRIHRLVDEGRLPCEHAAFAIRDYINPSLDTTISATGELIFQLAQNPDQWEALKQDPSLTNNAVNEAVRLCTPIRSFSRHAARDVQIGDITIPSGSRVMMLFASANRDERVFFEPNTFRLDRNSGDHLGFGSGIHMCVGMHLAQLEMEALIKAMITRVSTISIRDYAIAMNNSIRAFSRLETGFELEMRSFQVVERDRQPPLDIGLLDARVAKREMVAKDIVHLIFEPEDEVLFPKAEAGAHIDLHLRSDLVRQYSLTGPMDDGNYHIAVQLEPASKGGSIAVHDTLKVGNKTQLGGPRNNFPLVFDSSRILLFAGGIGITPLIPMAWALHREGRTFELHIAVRSRSRLAFGDQLESAPFASRVFVYADDEPNAAKLYIPDAIGDNTDGLHVYACGPKGFMDYVFTSAQTAGLRSDFLHLEHFGAEIDCDGEPFTLIAQKSGLELEVPTDKTILQALRDVGINIATSCENGVCGSCLTPVIEGVPEHRDMVQTATEKATNAQITVCCSRSGTKRLVLDI